MKTLTFFLYKDIETLKHTFYWILQFLSLLVFYLVFNKYGVRRFVNFSTYFFIMAFGLGCFEVLVGFLWSNSLFYNYECIVGLNELCQEKNI